MAKDVADNPGMKPTEKASIARAYVELEQLKLRLRMSPAPKAVDVAQWQAAKSKGKQSSHVLEFSETDDDHVLGEPSNGHAEKGN